MKKLLIFLLCISLLFYIVGCGSIAPAEPTISSAEEPSEPVEIPLNKEELEFHGIHLRLPSSIDLHYDEDFDRWYSLLHTDEPITGKIWLRIEVDRSFSQIEAREYSPEGALIHFAEDNFEKYEASMLEHTYYYQRVYLGGANVLIKSQSMDGALHTFAWIILKSNVVLLHFSTEDQYYDLLVRESIETLRVDDNEIPDITRITNPENLKSAGLKEQPLKACGLYLNVPESYIPVAIDEEHTVWAAPDNPTFFQLSEVSPSLLDLGEDEFAEHLSETDPNFEGFVYFDRFIWHDMYATKFLYSKSDGDSIENTYQFLVRPIENDVPALSLVAVSSDEIDDAITTMADTLRYGDGWTNGGLLEADPMPLEDFEAKYRGDKWKGLFPLP